MSYEITTEKLLLIKDRLLYLSVTYDQYNCYRQKRPNLTAAFIILYFKFNE